MHAFTGLPPGSDPTFVAFLLYWILALFVLCPMAWVLTVLSGKPWMDRLKRPVIGVLVAVALGSVFIAHAYAAEVPSIDACKELRDVYFWSWWQLWLIGCW